MSKVDIIGSMVNPSREEIALAIETNQKKQHHRFGELFSLDPIKKLRAAAVIIPLLEHAGQWHLLLTHRSEVLGEHRGQVAFPGGAQERGDKDLQATALREMHEEIGVTPQDVDIFGHLGDMPIITGYLVRPFVGQIPWPYPLEISTDEVQSAFIIPLDWLADPKNRTLEFHSFAGREFPVLFFKHYDGHQLWGASAEMALALLAVINLAEIYYR